MRKIILDKRKIDYNELIDYGFILNNDIYKYEKDILDLEFKVIIEIKGNEIVSKIIENAIDDEYLMVDIESLVGEYVGRVRDEYNLVINDVINSCTYKDIFKSEQAKKIIKYVKSKYKDDLEFLWEKYDDNAIWRNKTNNKWYGILLTVSAKKIGIDLDNNIEIIDLRYQKQDIEKIIDNKKIFPGYHMNKKSWITISLDNSVDIDTIYELIDNSYNLSFKK